MTDTGRRPQSGQFLRRAWPALGFGVVLAFASSVGQTYFIALFSGQIRAELGLSHGGFGGLYTAATLGSAACLLWLGKSADHFDLAILSLVALVGLSTCALLMANATSVAMLVAALFGLRLFGQGLLSHLMMTAMGRWFAVERGRALGVATLGYPLGEAVLPIAVASLLTFLAWRDVWTAAAIGMLTFILPLVWLLSRQVRTRALDQVPEAPDLDRASPQRSWTRAEVLGDPWFFALLPGLLAPAFIITGVLFHQVHVIETKSWSLALFAACYPLFAVSATVSAVTTGVLVDRFGSTAILPFYLLPLACGLAVLGVSAASVAAPIFMLLLGATAGAGTVLLGSLWPELYGTSNLGAIRSLVVSLLVCATAIAPGLLGVLIDANINFDWQLLGLSTYVFACAAAFAVISPRLLETHLQHDVQTP